MVAPVLLFDDPRLTLWSAPLDPSSANDTTLLHRFIRYAEMSPLTVTSAPLFGINKRILSIRHENRPLVLINPSVKGEGDYSLGMLDVWPGMSGLKIPRRRPQYVDISAMLNDGTYKDIQIRGQSAQLLHWHMQLLNGCAPISTMTGFEHFLASQMLYLRTEGWPLLLQRRLCAIAEGTEWQGVDSAISFDKNRYLSLPGLVKPAADKSAKRYTVDLRNPFAALTAADRYMLRFYLTRLANVNLCLCATDNPILAAGMNLMGQKSNIVTLTHPERQSVFAQLLQDVTKKQTRQVAGNLAELEVREKPDAILADWQWGGSDEKAWRNIIRDISKKLSAEGVLIMPIPDDSQFAALEQIFTKIFPQSFSIRNGSVRILMGSRSIDTPREVFQIHDANAAMPWVQHDTGHDANEVLAAEKFRGEAA